MHARASRQQGPSEAKANAAALKASRKKANAVRRAAADKIEASKRHAEKVKQAAQAPGASQIAPAAQASSSAMGSHSAADEKLMPQSQPQQNQTESISHEPIQSPGPMPSPDDAAALTLVKRLRAEAKERARRKAMAAAAESEAIRIEMEQLDAIKAKREAAEGHKKAAAVAARADKAARRRAEVQARLTRLGGQRRPGRDHPQQTIATASSGMHGLSQGCAAGGHAAEQQAAPLRSKKWQWRPPAPVLPSGDPGAASLAVAGMQVSGVSQALLAQAAAVDSAVPALQQRKASLAQLRANFDGASAGVSTPGSYYAPQYFSGGFDSARSNGFPRGLGPTSPDASRDGSPDMFQLPDVPLPQSSSPSTTATPRLRQGAVMYKSSLQPGFSNRSAASSRGSARSGASARLSPLGDRASLPSQAKHTQPPLRNTNELSDPSQSALGGVLGLQETARAVQAALLADQGNGGSRSNALAGRAKLPAFSQVKTDAPVLQSLGSIPHEDSHPRQGPMVPTRSAEQFGGGGAVQGWDSKEDAQSLEDSFVSQQSDALQQSFSQNDTPSRGCESPGSCESKHSPSEAAPLPITEQGAAAAPSCAQTSDTARESKQDSKEAPFGGAVETAPEQHEQVPPLAAAAEVRSKRLARMKEMLPVTPPGGRSMRTAKTEPEAGRANKEVDLSTAEVKHLADRMHGQAPVAAGGARPGPGLNRLYAAAAELDDESDEEDITPDAIAKQLEERRAAAGGDVVGALSKEEQAERALEIARNADFLKVLAGKKKKLASWNHAGEQQAAVEAFSGHGHSLSTAPSEAKNQEATDPKPVASASVREARLAALARRGL